MKKILGLLATCGLIWVGTQIAAQAHPYRNIRGSSAQGVNDLRRESYNNFSRSGRSRDSSYFEQRIIIEQRRGYDNCYQCSNRSPYNGNYRYPRSFNNAPVFFPNSPYSIYNRYNRGY